MTALTDWIGRAIRLPGYERGAVTQAWKAALAATVAWVVASWLLRLPQPFLAPYVALYLVQSSVYRSLVSSAQQFAAAAAGVGLAAGAHALIGAPTAAIAVVALVGLLIGHWRPFGDSGIFISTTAVLVIGFGAAGSSLLLLDRLLETAIGATIATLVNALLFPPLHARDAAATTALLTTEVTRLLREVATWLRAPTGSPDEWTRQITDLESLVRAAEGAVDQSEETRRLNPRRHWHIPHDPTSDTLDRLRRAWPYLRHITEAVQSAYAGVGPVGRPDERSRHDIADVITDLADVAAGQPPDRCEAHLRRLETGPMSPEAVTVLLPARHALDALTT